MKLSIKAKIFISLSLVIITTLGLNALFSHQYFSRILKEQVAHDVQLSMKQNSTYLEYILDNIDKFAQDVSVDEQLQSFLETAPGKEDVRDIVRINQMMSHLESLNHLRNYIDSAAVVTNDEAVYWTTFPFDKYFSDKLKETWYREVKENKTAVGKFSRIHVVFTDGNVHMNTISYVTNIKSVDHYNRSLGKLILNIRLEYLEDIVNQQSKEAAEYFLVNQDGQVLFSKNRESGTRVLMNQQAEKDYLIFHQKINNGWELISFYSKNSVFSKIAYIHFFFISTMFISIGLIILLIFPILSGIVRPIGQLSRAMKEVSKGNLNATIQINSHDEMEQLGDGFNKMIRDLDNHIFQSVQHEKDKRKMEFELLMAKINPHFIYNTLNTVVYLARKQKNYDIVEMVTSFINILQDTIRAKNLDEELFATISKEVEILKSYLIIQSYRYKDRFEVEWEMEEKLFDCVIPKNILQPLVENAIYHGISPMNEKGIIRISGCKEETRNQLVLAIEDNGVGMEAEVCRRLFEVQGENSGGAAMKPIGLASIRERIRFFYGDRGDILIESGIGKGTKITMLIPFEETIRAFEKEEVGGRITKEQGGAEN